LVGELFKHRTGIELTHVPYRGQSQVVSDLLAGTLIMSFEAMATAIRVVRAGQVRGLAITTRQRSAMMRSQISRQSASWSVTVPNIPITSPSLPVSNVVPARYTISEPEEDRDGEHAAPAVAAHRQRRDYKRCSGLRPGLPGRGRPQPGPRRSLVASSMRLVTPTFW
jgi:hypothetical protein